MSSPSNRAGNLRRLSTSSTPTDEKPMFQPTPPPGMRPSSTSSRPDSRSSSRPNSVASRTSLTDNLRLSRQNSLLAPLTTDICYDQLPDIAKSVTTIGRYHTIVPPIKHNSTMSRPISRSYSIMAETPIILDTSDEFVHDPDDDQAINSVSEENDPAAAPQRLENPLANPRYLETPIADFINNSEVELRHSPTLPTLPDEPADEEPRLRLAIKLPNGSRLERNFRPSDEMQTVLDFASVTTNSILVGHTLRSSDSKYKNLSSTLQECQIQNRTLLLIEPPDG